MSIERIAEKTSGNREKQDYITEDVRYYGAIPEKIPEEMTPEIIEQYYLWPPVEKRAGIEEGSAWDYETDCDDTD